MPVVARVVFRAVVMRLIVPPAPSVRRNRGSTSTSTYAYSNVFSFSAFETLIGSFSALSKPIFASKYPFELGLKALDDIYKMYTYASFGEKKNEVENEILYSFFLNVVG